MIKASFCEYFLLFFLGLQSLPLEAMDPDCRLRLRNELKASESVIVNDHYGPRSDRSWIDFKNLFDREDGGFSQRIEKIVREGGRWLDGGARAALPQRERLAEVSGELNPRCKFLALSLELSPELKRELDLEKGKHQGSFDYRIADLAKKDALPKEDLFEVESDFLGALSYSTEPLEVLKNYLHHLKDNGALYVAIRDDSTFVKDGNERIPLMVWIAKHIPGIEVSNLASTHDLFRIRILDRSKIKFNQSLFLRDWKSSTPPERVYDFLNFGDDSDY